MILRRTGYWGRNIYLSLGADGGSSGAIDIGVRNYYHDEKGNISKTDQGLGWEAYCYQCKTTNYQERPEDMKIIGKAPSGAKGAKMSITPNRTQKNKIDFYVQWLNGNGQPLGNPIDTTVTLSRNYNWTTFYRFGSLPTNDPSPSMSDGTFAIGSTFESAYLGTSSNTNWGIKSPNTPLAWIVNAPKCSIPYRWDVGEQFRIDHWA